MILTVCPNTALDKVIFVKKWTPGVPMRTNKIVTCVGGKGLDSSVVLSHLGVETVGLGFFSGNIGKELIEILKNYNVIPVPVWVGGNNRISYVIADESTNIHSHVIVGEVNVNQNQKEEFVEKFSEQINKAKWVIFAGSIPPSVDQNFYKTMIEIANNASVPSLVDTQNDFMVEAISAKPTVVKMNWKEFEWTFGLEALTINALYTQAKIIRIDKKLKNLILTLGENGILALTEEGDYISKAPYQKPVNAAGAGDAVSSVIVWRLSIGDSWPDVLRWASAISAAAVLTERTGDVCMDDVDRILPGVSVNRLISSEVKNDISKEYQNIN